MHGTHSYFFFAATSMTSAQNHHHTGGFELHEEKKYDAATKFSKFLVLLLCQITDFAVTSYTHDDVQIIHVC